MTVKERTTTTAFDMYEITSEGTSVWVNEITGGCVARFGRNGWEVPSKSMYSEKVDADGWSEFVGIVASSFGVVIESWHVPLYLKNK